MLTARIGHVFVALWQFLIFFTINWTNWTKKLWLCTSVCITKIMPVDSLDFRSICGRFYWVFQTFMCRRAVMAMTLHSNTSRVRCRCVLLAVIIASMLMCAGDVELNPGPPKKAATLSSIWTRSNNQSQAETNDEQIAATAPTLTDVVEMLAGLMAKVDQINATI